MTVTLPSLLVLALVVVPPMIVIMVMLWEFLSWLEPKALRWTLHRDGYDDDEIDAALARIEELERRRTAK